MQPRFPKCILFPELREDSLFDYGYLIFNRKKVSITGFLQACTEMRNILITLIHMEQRIDQLAIAQAWNLMDFIGIVSNAYYTYQNSIKDIQINEIGF